MQKRGARHLQGVFMNDIECPYCGKEQDIDHDDGYGFEEDEVFQQCCDCCEKTFGYTTATIYHYKPRELPCANEGGHELVDIKRFPEEFAVGYKRCVNCDEEILVDKEAMLKARAEYAKRTGLPF